MKPIKTWCWNCCQEVKLINPKPSTKNTMLIVGSCEKCGVIVYWKLKQMKGVKKA